MAEEMSSEEYRQARRDRLARAIGPHLQTGEVRTVDVPAKGGIIGHRIYLVEVACKDENVSTTQVTKDPERVRCPDCKQVMSEAARE